MRMLCTRLALLVYKKHALRVDWGRTPLHITLSVSELPDMTVVTVVNGVRVALYIIFVRLLKPDAVVRSRTNFSAQWLAAIVSLGLSGARIHLLMHPPQRPPDEGLHPILGTIVMRIAVPSQALTRSPRHYADSSALILLVTAIVSLFWAPYA